MISMIINIITTTTTNNDNHYNTHTTTTTAAATTTTTTTNDDDDDNHHNSTNDYFNINIISNRSIDVKSGRKLIEFSGEAAKTGSFASATKDHILYTLQHHMHIT